MFIFFLSHASIMLFEAPLIANFESWDLPLSHEPVDSELIYIQKTSDFLTGQ
jgi:hypothetical protein